MFDTGFGQVAPGRSASLLARKSVADASTSSCSRRRRSNSVSAVPRSVKNWRTRALTDAFCPAGRSARPLLLVVLEAEHAVPHVGDGTRRRDLRPNVVQA